MGILSRAALVVFILYAVIFWTQVATEKFEGTWIMAMAAVLIVSGMAFVLLGVWEDKP